MISLYQKSIIYSLIIWIDTQFIIGTYAYQEFIKIICHLKFKANQVLYSITTLKKFRKGLPLLPFIGKFINIDLKNISSKTLPLKEAYTFSTKGYIHHIINNQSLISKMYFEPDVEKKEKTELWHEDLWKESPLFGESLIIINNSEWLSIIIFNNVS